MPKQVTIKHVAKAAGVSAQTVSRVVNNRPDVSAETRRTVKAVIERLGYQPNALARSLIRRRSYTIGVITAHLDHYGPMRRLTGIEQAAHQLGYSLILSLLHTRETGSGERALGELLARQVDGIVWAVPEIGDTWTWLQNELPKIPTPIVFTGTFYKDSEQSRPTNRLIGRLAADHLLTQGYRHIGLISGPLNWEAARQRQQGWQDVIAQADPAQMVEGDWSAASGAAGLKRLLQQYSDLDAVYAANDQMALGALQVAHQVGMRIPDDLGIVGTDNIPESAYFWPALTTVRHQFLHNSRMIVEKLHFLIEQQQQNDAQTAPEFRYSEPELIVRQSSHHL